MCEEARQHKTKRRSPCHDTVCKCVLTLEGEVCICIEVPTNLLASVLTVEGEVCVYIEVQMRFLANLSQCTVCAQWDIVSLHYMKTNLY